MRSLDLGPREYEPPSLCHTGIETLFALGAGEVAAAGAAAATAAEIGTGAAVLGSWSPLAAAAPAASGIFGTGIGLSEIGTVAGLAGSGLQAIGQMQQADYEAEVAKNQAEALRIRAGEETAAAQRRQIAEERKAGLISSRARALAASSGTDATSPTQVDLESDIAGQGQYNALSSLYEGLAESRASNYQADIELFKSRRIRSAVPLAVGGTLLSGLSSFASRRARSSSGYDRLFGNL